MAVAVAHQQATVLPSAATGSCSHRTAVMAVAAAAAATSRARSSAIRARLRVSQPSHSADETHRPAGRLLHDPAPLPDPADIVHADDLHVMPRAAFSAMRSASSAADRPLGLRYEQETESRRDGTPSVSRSSPSGSTGSTRVPSSSPVAASRSGSERSRMLQERGGRGRRPRRAGTREFPSRRRAARRADSRSRGTRTVRGRARPRPARPCRCRRARSNEARVSGAVSPSTKRFGPVTAALTYGDLDAQTKDAAAARVRENRMRRRRCQSYPATTGMPISPPPIGISVISRCSRARSQRSVQSTGSAQTGTGRSRMRRTTSRSDSICSDATPSSGSAGICRTSASPIGNAKADHAAAPSGRVSTMNRRRNSAPIAGGWPRVIRVAVLPAGRRVRRGSAGSRTPFRGTRCRDRSPYRGTAGLPRSGGAPREVFEAVGPQPRWPQDW